MHGRWAGDESSSSPRLDSNAAVTNNERTESGPCGWRRLNQVTHSLIHSFEREREKPRDGKSAINIENVRGLLAPSSAAASVLALEEQQQVQAGVVIVVSWSFHHIDAGWVHNTASIIDHRLTLRLVHSCSCIVLCHFRWTSGIGIDSSVRPRGTQQWATKGKNRTLLFFPSRDFVFFFLSD